MTALAPEKSAPDAGAAAAAVSYRWAFYAALAVFALAGLTGAWMRFGLIYGFPWGLQYANIRHAHSHLMYFSWATPALMALIAGRLPDVSGRPAAPRFRGPILVALFGGLLAYMPFLLYGYRPASIGGLNLPLSVMAAGVNIIGWYWFVWVYRAETRGVPRNEPLQLWDAALIFLIFATLGGWGLPIVTILDVQDPFWSLALTHIFLDIFAFGWFILALLGIAYSANPAAGGSKWAARGLTLAVSGLPVVFILGMPQHVVPPALYWLGALGGLLLAAGLLAHVAVLWPLAGRRWQLALFFLALVAVTMIGTLWPEVARWATIAGLRIPYLHWLLLGFVTLGLVTAAAELWGDTAVPLWSWLAAAILLLILTLFPLTTLWPAALRGPWTRHAAAWAALGPPLVALAMLWHARRHTADV
jgi:hypothetical protein